MERRRPIIPVEYFPNRKNGKRNPPNLSQKRKLVTVEQPPQTASIATVKRTRNAAVDRTKTPRQSNDLSPPVIDAVLEQRIENPVPIDEAQHSPRETQNHSVIDQRRSENQPNGDMHMFDAFIDQQVENSVPAAGAQHSRRETQNDVVNRMENTRPNDVLPLPNPEIMQLNHAVGPDMHMHDAVQNPVNISTPPSEQQAEPSPSILSLSQQVEQFKCLVAKKDKQIEIYQSTVKSLNERLGVEDLTVEEQKHYGQILLSSAEGSSDSDDSDGENFDGEPANKENHASNVSNAPQTDMSFSFSHQFVLDVSTCINVYTSVRLFSHLSSGFCVPFLQKQKTRHYSSVKIDIPNHAVKMLKALNKTKVFKTMVGDGKFIETLLKCVFSANTLKIATFDTLTKPKIAFIKGT